MDLLPSISDMTHRIGIVVFDGMTLLDASGPAEVFHLADPTGEHYELETVSPAGGNVKSSSGMVLAQTIASTDTGDFDTVLIAGGHRLVDEPMDEALLEAVEALSARASRVASVCTGAFVLAELGFLDDRRATTHWRHAHTLARRYPRVQVEPDVIHIRDGRFLSSAGISAGIDLALALVEEDTGAAAARTVARELVMFMQRPGGQSQFSTALSQPPARSGLLRELMEAIAADPAAGHSVASMASAIGVSVRHLNRMFQAETSTTPARWLEQVRVDAARALILDGHPIARVAERSGLGSDETLRRAFARHLGTTPTAFRDRFSTTAHQS
ncbi:AraC family transcriptional regulator with amidase-like domain [Citricoccus muralis]|uniref:AraC family transcriptional regulator with amidase-like domain n=2 Tax=Citricoccus muralis TaxID=169134 RepID=A0A3D9L9V0_9MICC|nr:AraC family transcriptional regulator with amidase-like domain [Citricoccus muralis]